MFVGVMCKKYCKIYNRRFISTKHPSYSSVKWSGNIDKCVN